MGIKDFKEKQIREKILNKVNPKIQKGQGKHNKGYVFLNGVLITKVKIPNNHEKLMRHSKSKYIAGDLRLSPEDFNDLIQCPLTGPNYYKKLQNWSDKN